jgi:hypothetical protein
MRTTNERDRCGRQGERGSILLAVAFMAALLGVLSLSMFSLMTADTEEVHNHVSSVRALGIAEAGVEHAIMKLRQNAHWKAGLKNVKFPKLSNDRYSVEIDQTDYPAVQLLAVGETGGFTRRLEVVVNVDGPPAKKPYTVTIESWREP